jgi:hypothetical protein
MSSQPPSRTRAQTCRPIGVHLHPATQGKQQRSLVARRALRQFGQSSNVRILLARPERAREIARRFQLVEEARHLRLRPGEQSAISAASASQSSGNQPRVARTASWAGVFASGGRHRATVAHSLPRSGQFTLSGVLGE